MDASRKAGWRGDVALVTDNMEVKLSIKFLGREVGGKFNVHAQTLLALSIFSQALVITGRSLQLRDIPTEDSETQTLPTEIRIFSTEDLTSFLAVTAIAIEYATALCAQLEWDSSWTDHLRFSVPIYSELIYIFTSLSYTSAFLLSLERHDSFHQLWTHLHWVICDFASILLDPLRTMHRQICCSGHRAALHDIGDFDLVFSDLMVNVSATLRLCTFFFDKCKDRFLQFYWEELIGLMIIWTLWLGGAIGLSALNSTGYLSFCRIGTCQIQIAILVFAWIGCIVLMKMVVICLKGMVQSVHGWHKIFEERLPTREGRVMLPASPTMEGPVMLPPSPTV
ncbi:hypothetical protein BT96DRAFT_949321 [Gymnopus androsaceus JB14]|uniref:Uncharacterized protein n=1 Tax=Gymnopus androsaceus JB14 TaxID=1447944 RepID=A0A6A4GKJ6_9AGAR|nr:hypothetical protein BT96DRAFT_949321 [Gymnopus androsaceus JB14]